jgi:hypothetical protein
MKGDNSDQMWLHITKGSFVPHEGLRRREKGILKVAHPSHNSGSNTA